MAARYEWWTQDHVGPSALGPSCRLGAGDVDRERLSSVLRLDFRVCGHGDDVSSASVAQAVPAANAARDMPVIDG